MWKYPDSKRGSRAKSSSKGWWAQNGEHLSTWKSKLNLTSKYGCQMQSNTGHRDPECSQETKGSPSQRILLEFGPCDQGRGGALELEGKQRFFFFSMRILLNAFKIWNMNEMMKGKKKIFGNKRIQEMMIAIESNWKRRGNSELLVFFLLFFQKIHSTHTTETYLREIGDQREGWLLFTLLNWHWICLELSGHGEVWEVWILTLQRAHVRLDNLQNSSTRL